MILYYTTAFTVAGLFFHPALAWFTPIGAFGGAELATPVSIALGILLQVAASIYLVFTIRQLLAPPAGSSAVASAATGS